MFDPSSYSVGWICAIETEFVAALALLDRERDADDWAPPHHDDNSYTFKGIAKHNVIFAVMSGGEYGTTSAANVARAMIRTFQHIRIGLMVGIGGGAPTASNDIRLGDVVVSRPGSGNGGVLQYDYGKTIQGQSFQMAGHLNQPSALLLRATADLSARFKLRGHSLDGDIEKACTAYPKIRGTHQRPDQATDCLYKSSFLHEDSRRDCAELCNNADGNLLSRRPRTLDEDNPAIFFGLIASGNRLMKDAEARDTLAEEKGVLCFEMNAAGLMNQFPFLVVRGICDYSDAHKHKSWQGYAAMTAAAYTKHCTEFRRAKLKQRGSLEIL